MARVTRVHYYKDQSEDRSYWDRTTMCNRRGSYNYMFASVPENVTCPACIKAMRRKGVFGEDVVVVDDDTESYLARLGIQDYDDEHQWDF